MACYGSKALKHTKHSSQNSKMAAEDAAHPKHRHNKNKKHGKNYKKPPSDPSTTHLRKRVDPETAKYFTEIGNLFESSGIDVEERSVLCGNALEETRGKERELATDVILSRTLQTLLEGCDVGQLCDFLVRCVKELPLISTDKSGSHVVETALRALSLHLQNSKAFATIEDTVSKIVEIIVVNPVEVMCSRYGSHVLRSLLCLCKGIPLDSSGEFHKMKSSSHLAERVNSRILHSGGSQISDHHHGLPDLLKSLVRGIVKCAKADITALQTNQNSSFVLQKALKVLTGDDGELLHIIPTLLGSHEDNIVEGEFIQHIPVQQIKDLLKDNAYSHLMEVILEVAPEALCNEIYNVVFKGAVFDICSHDCGSFVVQALISSARSQGQIDLIWKELSPKIEDLLANGKSGVVASLLAACQRFHINERECCQAIAAAVRSSSESPSCIIPRILFLEGYFSGERSCWNWPYGVKMHTLGCLMLQTIFKYSNDFIQLFIKSLVSMEADYIIETAKDAGGARVLESFLSSDSSSKNKNKVVSKLRGSFGELSMHPSSSFTVEKCFAAVNMSLKEVIASELLAVEAELSKTKHGPYILKKLDIVGFAKRPDQWKSRLVTKQNVHKEFTAMFGSETVPKNRSFLSAKSSQPSLSECSLKQMMKEINQSLEISTSKRSGSEFLSLNSSLAKLGFSKQKCRKSEKHNVLAGEPILKNIMKNDKGKKKHFATDTAELSSKRSESAKCGKRLLKSVDTSTPKKKVKT